MAWKTFSSTAHLSDLSQYQHSKQVMSSQTQMLADQNQMVQQKKNLTSLSRCNAFWFALVHLANTDSIDGTLYTCSTHGNHKPPSASIVRRKKKGSIKKMKYRVRRQQCWNLQGLLTNVWPQTCGVERGVEWGKYGAIGRRTTLWQVRLGPDSSKSPGCQSLCLLLLYWLLYWFKTTCYRVMKHPRK